MVNSDLSAEIDDKKRVSSRGPWRFDQIRIFSMERERFQDTHSRRKHCHGKLRTHEIGNNVL